jgi:antitoxin HigA-1
MAMHNPPHPGEVIREEILKPLGLSVSKAAQHLGVSRQILSKVLEGNGAVTPEIAYRLSLLFKPSAESWLQQQAAFDLWQLRQHTTDIHVMSVEV